MKNILLGIAMVLVFNTLLGQENVEVLITSGHSSSVRDIYVSKDKKYLVSGGMDGVVILWDLKNLQMIKAYNDIGNGVKSVAISIDNKYIYVGTESKGLYIINVNTKEVVNILFKNTKTWSNKSDIQINNDGFLISYLMNGMLYIINDKAKYSVNKLEMWSSTRFFKEQKWIAGHFKRKIFISNYETSERVFKIRDGIDDYWNKIKLLNNDSVILSWGKEKLKVFDIVTGKLLDERQSEHNHILLFADVNSDLDKYVTCEFEYLGESVSEPKNSFLKIYDTKTKKAVKLKGVFTRAEFIDSTDIIICIKKNKIFLYDISKDNGLKEFRSEMELEGVVTFSTSKNNEVCYAGSNGVVTTLDLATLSQGWSKNLDKTRPSVIKYIGQNVVVGALDGRLNIKQGSTGIIVKELEHSKPTSERVYYNDEFDNDSYLFLPIHPAAPSSIAYDSYKRNIYVGTATGGLVKYNLYTGNSSILMTGNATETKTLLGTPSYVGKPIHSISSNPLNSNVLCAVSDNSNILCLKLDNEVLVRMKGSNPKIDLMKEYIYFINEGRIKKYKIGNGDVEILGFISSDDIRNFVLKTNGKEITTISKDNVIRVWDLKNKRIISELTGHNAIITNTEYLALNKMIITSSMDKTLRIWNIENKEEILSIFCFSNSDYFFYKTPDGYYYSSKIAARDLKFVKGISTYSFEQFDIKYNRPDIILDRLGYADSTLIAAYHQAFLKRLKKMNFTEDMLKDDFHLPEIKIENFEEVPTITDSSSVGLNLKLNDSKYKLDRINVWVNDVAVYGSNGISLREKNIQDYTTTLSVELAKGKNKVQVSVLNQAGAESYKETFEIECKAGKIKPNLYLITIGESKFKDANYNLTYAAKDANDVATLFAKSKNYEKVITKTLTNEEVTKENITALRSFLEQADINDEVMIFIAGHGVLDENLDYFFASYDMDFNNPSQRGIAYEDLEGLLDGIKPLKKVLLIDACHSGEIDKEEVELLAVNEAVAEEGIQFRAVGNTIKPKLGMQNTLELTKALFTDLRKGTGATVISSAGGGEYAMESGEWKNGLFTYTLLKGIETGEADLNNDGEIWLKELQEYVQTQVTELSGGKQMPTSRIENSVLDYRVW